MIFTDDSEDESDTAEPSEDNEDGEDTFMHSYSDALNEEMKSTTLEKSFVRANEQAPKRDEVYFSFLQMDIENCVLLWYALMETPFKMHAMLCRNYTFSFAIFCGKLFETISFVCKCPGKVSKCQFHLHFVMGKCLYLTISFAICLGWFV